MEETTIEDDRACFCKIILKDYSTNSLRIPPQFVQLISEEALKGITLKGPSGDHWQVKPFKVSRSMYLGDGWQQFVRDNSLGNGEFLVFSYDGATCFQVQIFDKNGLERINVASIRKESMGKQNKQAFSVHDGLSNATGQDLGDTNRLKNTSKKESKLMEIKEEEDHIPISQEKGTERKLNTRNTDLPVPFSSNLPYFWMRMQANYVERVFVLPIPHSFSSTCLTRDKMKIITLQNQDGKSWEVNCTYNCNRNNFCGGWRAFVRDNTLEEGDICIFELVSRNKMQFHVFR